MPETGKQPYLDFITEPFRKWLEFIKPNAGSYYLGLLKIYFASLAATVAITLLFLVVAVGLVLAFSLGSSTSLSSSESVIGLLFSNIALVILLLLLGLIFVVLVSWIGSSVDMTAYLYTDALFRNKPFGIIEAFGRIKGSVFRYLVLNFFIRLVISLPLLVAVAAILIGGMSLFEGGEPSVSALIALFASAMLLIIILAILLAVLTVIFDFFTQFWFYGFLIEGRGVIESLKRSIHLVKTRFFETLGFNVLWVLLLFALLIPALVYGFVSDVFFEVFDAALGSLGWIYLAFYLFALVFDAVISILLSTISQAFALPCQYIYWRKISERSGEETGYREE